MCTFDNALKEGWIFELSNTVTAYLLGIQSLSEKMNVAIKFLHSCIKANNGGNASALIQCL